MFIIGLFFLSAALYVFSFAPWDQGFLQWLAFVPAFYAIRLLESKHVKLRTRALLKKIFAYAFLLNVLIGAGGFYWVNYAVKQYGELPGPLAFFIFILFCMIGQLHLPFYFCARSLAKKNAWMKKHIFPTPLLWAVGSGVLYVGIESLYPKIFMDTAGHAFYRSPLIRQAADIGGPFFLTALVLIFNELLFDFFLYKKKKSLLTGLGLLVSLYAYGFFRTNQIQSAEKLAEEGPLLRVAMIQANIGDFLKVAAERGLSDASRRVVDTYLNLSTQAQNGLARTGKQNPPDIILWPETAYPSLFGHPLNPSDQQIETEVKTFAHQFPGTLLFGGYDQDSKLNDYNSLFFLNGKSPKTQVYHKNILLTFGETLPFADQFPSIKSWFPNMGFFGRGPGPEVFSVPNQDGTLFQLAPQICYEGLFAKHSAIGEDLGADALLNITNDSWFGMNGEPYLHLALTIFRTIETRTPLIRATNTGFSVFVNSTGEITQSSALFTPDILQTTLPKRPAIRSPFLILGSWFGYEWFTRLCQLISLLMFCRKPKSFKKRILS